MYSDIFSNRLLLCYFSHFLTITDLDLFDGDCMEMRPKISCKSQ